MDINRDFSKSIEYKDQQKYNNMYSLFGQSTETQTKLSVFMFNQKANSIKASTKHSIYQNNLKNFIDDDGFSIC